jgi:CHAT domain-containing protein
MIAHEVLPRAVDQTLAQAYIDRSNQVAALERDLQAAERAGTPDEALHRKVVDARTALRQAWEKVQHVLAVEPLDWAGLRRVAPQDGALVIFRITGEGAWAFLVGAWSPEDGPLPEDVVPIPGVTYETLDRWLGQVPAPVNSWVDAWNRGERTTVIQTLAADGGEYTAGWFIAYGLRRATLFARRRAKAQLVTAVAGQNLDGHLAAVNALDLAYRAEEAAQRGWHRTIEAITGELHTALLAPVLARLDQLRTTGQVVRWLTFIPQRGLHLLPLHAAWQPSPNGGRRYLVDDYVVAYAPAGAALARCRDRWAERATGEPSLVAIGNPTGDLSFAGREAEGVLERFPPQVRRVLRGPEADKATVLAALPGARYGHYAGHGYFDLQDPLNAGIVLADGEGGTALTLADILAEVTLPEMLLMVLCGCETQQVAPGDPADEYVGLPAGFLIAGAATVVGSLWMVDDLATAWLMERFYDELLGPDARPRCTPAEALRAAQCWLRDLPLVEALARLQQEVQMAGQAGALRQAGDLKDLMAELQSRGDPPFQHPVWWAAFAAAGM